MNQWRNNIPGKMSLLLLLLLVLGWDIHAQNRRELEQKRKNLQKEIHQTNELLEKTKKQKQLTLSQLELLHQKIAQRQALLNTIKKEIAFINQQISQYKEKISHKEEELRQLKEEYAHLIRQAYKHQSSVGIVMFIFMSESFNQAYRRLNYLRQYNAYRRRQAELIVKTAHEIEESIKEMENLKAQREMLFSENEKEKQLIEEEKQEQEKLAQQLASEENRLKEELKKKQVDAQKLSKLIEELVKKEMEEARKAAEKNKTSVSAKNAFPLTPEAQKLSNSFAANKGKLPWPVDKGVISGRFGQYEHPVLKGVIINNNGIDISTEKGAHGKALFEGEVSSVIIIPGAGKAVMIRHGEYLTVYSYFSEVFVKKGDKVKTKQELGTLIMDEDEEKSTLHLEIWKGTTKLNPEYWLSK